MFFSCGLPKLPTFHLGKAVRPLSVWPHSQVLHPLHYWHGKLEDSTTSLKMRVDSLRYGLSFASPGGPQITDSCEKNEASIACFCASLGGSAEDLKTASKSATNRCFTLSTDCN